MVTGEVGLGAVDISDGSRVLGSAPGGPPMLPEWLEWGSADRRENRQFWVQEESPEVEGDVLCSPNQLEDAGDLLLVW